MKRARRKTDKKKTILKAGKRASQSRSFSLQSIQICYIMIRTIKSGENGMMNDTSKILNVFVAFCRENLDILMIGGVVLIAVVIAVSFLKTSKKNEEEDLDFYEELEIKDTKQDSKEDEIPKVDEAKPENSDKGEPNLTEDKSKLQTEEDGKNEIDNLVNEAFDKFIETSLSDAFKNILEEIDEEYERNQMATSEEKSEENSVDKTEEEPQEESTADEEELQEPVVSDEPVEEARETSDDEDIETFEEVDQEEPEQEENKEPELVAEPLAEEKPLQEESCFEKATNNSSNNVSKNTSCIEYIVEGLASLSGDGVKEVGIKIPGAEVKITYCKEDAQSEKASKDQETDEMEADGDVSGSVADNAIVKDDKTEIQPKPRKKFGPDNMNVSRSGKVYSEEELELQIRD